MDTQGEITTFTYGRSYLKNPAAIALYLPDLPLQRGAQHPRSGHLPGCVADTAPDTWGRRVIEYQHRRADGALSELGYLLNSSSDRVDALDFQTTPDDYIVRDGGQATLDKLHEAARHVKEGRQLPASLPRRRRYVSCSRASFSMFSWATQTIIPRTTLLSGTGTC